MTLQDERRVPLRLIGPGAQGWVCHTEDRKACYRLLPIGGGYGRPRECEDSPVERRVAFRGWMAGATPAPEWTRNPVARGLAPISADGHGQLPVAGHQGWYYVRYDVAHVASLAEILAKSDPYARFDAVLSVIYRVQSWWQDLRTGLLPSAADVVFDADKRPILLPTPPWRHPDIGSIFAEPARTLILAPEYLRGVNKAGAEGSLDRFSLGAIGLQVFRSLPDCSDAARALPGAATGAIWQGLASRCPIWLQRLPATDEAEQSVRRLLDPDPSVRGTLDLAQLIHTLEQCRRRMQPVHAARELLQCGRAKEAYGFIKDMLQVDGSCAMLVVAADVARQIGRSLEAVDWLERAIEAVPGELAAVRQQFEILISEGCRDEIQVLADRDPQVKVLVDQKMRRNFHELDAAEPESEEWETGLIDHLFWRDQETQHLRFIHRRLHDKDDEKKHLWWKFPLRFLYVAALDKAGSQWHAAGNLKEGKECKDKAVAEFKSIIDALHLARSEHRLDANLIEQYFHEAYVLAKSLKLPCLPPGAS